jgi:serine/threonine protein kinase/Tol biopolymer transport system component
VSLAPGTRLGPYEVLSQLGSGGMGEVYTARDTRLDRLVAIKTSRAEFSQRFEREARAIAALNHPNVCQLFDVGPSYLVMERVDGAPIHAPLEVGRLLTLAIQIADGLAAAHAAGIVHRDLKPSNVMVTSEGQVKLLDFGLAMMAPEPIGSSGETRARLVTEAGTTVGTAAYMSPEQARGEEIDARTDLWSLGVVLYELATGVRPFDGSATPVIFTQLLSQQPVPVRQRDPRVPVELERVISRLLEKDRETRYQSAADVRADLKRIARDTSDPIAVAARPEGSSRSGWRGMVIAASIVAALVLAMVGWWAFRGDGEPIARPSAWQQLTNFTDALVDPSLSPDGRMVTFIRANSPAQFPRLGHVFVKLLPAGESVQLTSSIEPRYAPGFTPDGSRVAYTEVAQAAKQSTWDTWTVPISGGEPTRMLPNASGLVWIDPQHVLFSQIMGSGIHMGIVTSTTGRADERPIYYPEHERAMAHYSYLSPDRRSVLVVEMDRTGHFQRCRLTPFDGRGAGTQVGPSGACVAAAWSPDGHWMYLSVIVNGASHLWRQRFPNGAPEQLTFGPTEETGVSVAPDGRSLITSVGQRRSAIWLKTPQAEREVSIEGVAIAPTLSIDGRRLYYLLLQRSRDDSFVEFRSLDLSTGRTDRPLPDRSVMQYDLSPDERDVAFTTRGTSGTPEIWLAPLDRSAPPRRVTESGDSVSFAASELVFRELDGKANYLTRIGKDGRGRRRIIEAPIVDKGDSSPDGAWVIASVPSESSRTGVGFGTVIRSLRDTAQISLCPRGGFCPAIFSPDSRWLYVTLPSSGDQPRAGQKSVAIRVGDHGELPASLESIVAAAAQGALPPHQSGAVMLDGGFRAPGPDPSAYAYVKQEVQSNLYRIAIR